MFKKLKRQTGSTIVEFMTVMFIISGIAAMIIPNIQIAVYKAKLTACTSNIRNIAQSLELYKNENERYPKTLLHLVPRYLANVPSCPEAKKDTYSESYEVSDEGLNFTVYCKGRNHQRLGLPADTPLYNYGEGGFKKYQINYQP